MPIRVISCPKNPVQKERVIRNAIATFEKGIRTLHATDAAVLPHVIAHAEERGIGYTLTAVPRLGYYLEKAT